MYQNDSFYSLSIAGQIGLVLLSLFISIGIVWIAHKLSRNQNIVSRLCIALGLFYAFIWLSPQIYYSYYWLIFENLPVQNVIKRPPSLGKIANLIFFQERASYSNHGKGLLFLLLILVAIKPRGMLEWTKRKQ